MKKRKTKVIALSVVIMLGAAWRVSAQPYYRQNLYPTNPVTGQSNQVSSVTLTTIHSTDHQLIASYETTPYGSGLERHFQIRVIDEEGGYNSTTPSPAIPDFFNTYVVLNADGGCGGPLKPASQIYGVSAIETGVSSGQVADISYAVTGTIDNTNVNPTTSGCFFTFLDGYGAPNWYDGAGISSSAYAYYYEFPSTAQSPTKPYIVESQVNLGQYYVCGSYYDTGLIGNNGGVIGNNVWVMYVMKIDGSNGSLLSSYTYTSGGMLQPRDMVLSPFGVSEEVVIIGRSLSYPYAGSRRFDGFFINLSADLSNVNTFKTYDVNQLLDDFNSITVAYSNSGYVIGGQETPVITVPKSWVLKLDASGNVVWSTHITGSSNSNKEISSVIERKNQSLAYEYYTATNDGNGMVVFKLDDNGNLYGGATEYDYTGAGSSAPVYLTNINNSAASYSEGIQVYGTDISSSDTYAVKAYYSGESGLPCPYENLNTGAMQAFNTPSVITPPITQSTGINFITCFNENSPNGFSPLRIRHWFELQSTPNFNILCSASNVPGGSNARTIGIAEQDVNADIRIFPNPVHNEITVSFGSVSGNVVSINLNLYDYTGRLVKNFENEKLQNGNEIKLDLLNLKLSNGMYFIKTTVNNKTQTQKIVIE